MERFLGKKLPRILLTSLMILCVCFSVCACGNDEDDDSQNHVYKATDIEMSDSVNLNGFDLYPYQDGFCLYGMLSPMSFPAEETAQVEEAPSRDMPEEYSEDEPLEDEPAEDEPVDEDASDVSTDDSSDDTTIEESTKKSNAYDLWGEKTINVNSKSYKEYCDYLAAKNPNSSIEEDIDGEAAKSEYVPTLRGREYFYFFDNTGTELGKFYFELYDEQVGNVFFSPSGDIFMLNYVRIVDENNPVNSEDSYNFKRYGILRKFNKDGELLTSLRIDDSPEVKRLEDIMPGSDYEHRYMLCGTADNICVYACGHMLIYDNNLKLISYINKSKVDKRYLDGTTILDKNGNLYINYYDNDVYEKFFAKCNPMKGTIERGIQPLNDTFLNNVYPGFDSQFIIYKNGSIYNYNYGDLKGSLLVDFTASNIATDYIRSMAELDDTHLVSLYSSIEDGKYHLGYLTKVNPEDVVVKKTLTLALVYPSNELKQAVVAFNKSNENYNIKIIDYHALYGNQNDWGASDAVIEKLNVDIISGNMPDLLMTANPTGSSLSIDPYIRKDLIEDLYPYIENDSELNIDDYDRHFMDMFAKDGKLYAIVPSYSIQTIYAKKSIVGDAKTWTISQVLDYMDEYDCAAFISFADRDSMLQFMMIQSGEQFINEENATCSFNSEEFKQAIRFLERIPEKIDYYNMGYDYDTRFISNKVLADTSYISDFNMYNSWVYGDFGEPVTNIGFPTSVGSGSCIYPDIKLSMSSKSKDKEGCWEFIRYFLTDAYQGNERIIENSLPLKLKYLDQKFDKAKEPPCYKYFDVDQGKDVVQYITYFTPQGEEKQVPGLSDEQISEIKELMYRIDHADECDSKIIKIISEEIKDYFDGNASLDDVCNRIQSRVQIYLYEIQ